MVAYALGWVWWLVVHPCVLVDASPQIDVRFRFRLIPTDYNLIRIIAPANAHMLQSDNGSDFDDDS